MEEETTYSKAGVEIDKEGALLKGLLRHVVDTFDFRDRRPGRPILGLRHFANVLDLGDGRGLAISTDGVGTKMLVAEMMQKYDTVGIDCVAMNVNDVLAVGAEPIAMVNYVAAEKLHPEILEQLGVGLAEGARQARISICGGETAQLREMIRGRQEGMGLDLAGTVVGLVDLQKIIIGDSVREKDLVVGLGSSGVHSNGLTLARKVFFEKLGLAPQDHLPGLQRTIGEELLEPTRIYVAQILEMLAQGVRIAAAAHITGGGFLNLRRVEAEVGFVLDSLPTPQPVFRLMAERGGVSLGEMYTVFNMGVGFCIVCPESDFDRVSLIATQHDTPVYCLGHVVPDPDRSIVLPKLGLMSKGKKFVSS
jgi:phosphoribosylformylglycinamidine cyclo-ligase